MYTYMCTHMNESRHTYRPCVSFILSLHHVGEISHPYHNCFLCLVSIITASYDDTILIKEPPPPWGVFFLLSYLIKNPEEEDPPRSTWYKFFEGGPLTPGSSSGNMVNRKPPWDGSFISVT